MVVPAGAIGLIGPGQRSEPVAPGTPNPGVLGEKVELPPFKVTLWKRMICGWPVLRMTPNSCLSPIFRFPMVEMALVGAVPRGLRVTRLLVVGSLLTTSTSLPRNEWLVKL